MAVSRVVVIGASAGGVSALKTLVGTLPSDLPAALFVVLHVSPTADSRLPEILNRLHGLPAAHAADGERIREGRIYIARPDHHLLIQDGFVRVTQGPRQNLHRPAIDPLFRSAARAYRSKAIGVILTGALDDGTAGLKEVVARGGIGIVQDPDEADTPDMPRSALEFAQPQYCLPLRGIGTQLVDLLRLPAPPASDDAEADWSSPAEKEPPVSELAAMALAPDANESLERVGAPSAFTCPECHGTLWEVDDGELIHYRCRVGHAYSEGTMTQAHARSVERALWLAMRCLQENASLTRRLAVRAAGRQQTALAVRFEQRADEMERRAHELRGTLLDLQNEAPAEETEP